MPKYQINYGRSVPDHRVPFDYDFVKKVTSPFEYFKHFKQGFNVSWFKYYHMHLVNIYLIAAFAISGYLMWDETNQNIMAKRVRYPSNNIVLQTQLGNKAPYDNVLQKFSNQPLKDQPFNTY